jgi:two-component system, NtrC family, sensor kinase
LDYSDRGYKLKLKFYGLRTGILAQLLFLIIAAMLLVNVAMLSLSQRHLLQCKADAGKLLIRSLGFNVGHTLKYTETNINTVFKDDNIIKQADDLLSSGGYHGLVLTDLSGAVFYPAQSSTDISELASLARISLHETEMSTNYRGNTWGVFWLGKKEVIVSGPLTYQGNIIGGAAISSPLDSVYKSLRESERLVLLYIILDTLVLGIVGIYLLSRIVVNPIHRLLKITDRYMAEDMPPAIPEDSGNEIGSLSRSLSIMLQRLDENKQALKGHILSLEKANAELKQAQNEVIRSEKLASVGRLAAGLAHEIGNPLGIILGYLELIKKEDVQEEEKRDFLSRIESEITRINIIIRQLLDFSRPSQMGIEEHSVHNILTDTVNMLRPYPLMEDIHIELDLKAGRDTVCSDSGQLRQVFLNIIMNAADVLNEHACAPSSSSKEIIIATGNNEDHIEIKFTDNGPGIDQDKIERIFDPFFTTKEPGKGTGLGLSVSYMIIESLGGKIRAESIKDKGASIIVNLPIHDNKIMESGDVIFTQTYTDNR